MSTFAAKYHGRCSACHERIEPGQDVRFTDDSDLIHADCDDLPDERPPGPLCDSCWLTKPCGCDDQ